MYKIQNARAEPLFCSLNLLFGDAYVAVAVVVCENSLFFVLNVPVSGFISKYLIM